MGGLYSSTEKRTGFLVSVNRYPDDRKFIGSPDKAVTAKFAMEGEFKSPKSIEEAISLLESGQATIVGLSTLDSTGLKDDGPTTLVEYKFTKGELKIKTRGMSPGGGGELSSISSIYKER